LFLARLDQRRLRDLEAEAADVDLVSLGGGTDLVGKRGLVGVVLGEVERDREVVAAAPSGELPNAASIAQSSRSESRSNSRATPMKSGGARISRSSRGQRGSASTSPATRSTRETIGW
jgi:hypothetical protein